MTTQCDIEVMIPQAMVPSSTTLATLVQQAVEAGHIPPALKDNVGVAPRTTPCALPYDVTDNALPLVAWPGVVDAHAQQGGRGSFSLHDATWYVAHAGTHALLCE